MRKSAAQARFFTFSSWIQNINKEPAFKKCLPEISDDRLTDHGILSAWRVAQLLMSVSVDHEQNTVEADHKKANYYAHAVHAIAHHNLQGKTVKFVTHPLACLLRLCDELQEWNRQRVNNEKVIKNLYLDIQNNRGDEIKGYEMFQRLRTNIVAGRSKEGKLEFRLSEKDKPQFKFMLDYKDALEANYIPAFTLIKKSYNLQHLDLFGTHYGSGDLSFMLELDFPKPAEYNTLSEYDIYAFYAEKDRRFPLFERSSNSEKAEPGLTWLDTSIDEKNERFSIKISRAADHSDRRGWLTVCPDYIFNDYKDFRFDFLIGRRIYPKSPK